MERGAEDLRAASRCEGLKDVSNRPPCDAPQSFLCRCQGETGLLGTPADVVAPLVTLSGCWPTRDRIEEQRRAWASKANPGEASNLVSATSWTGGDKGPRAE